MSEGSAKGNDRPAAALVTGGSSGIGLACVKALLHRSFRVLFCARSDAGLANASGELRDRGFRADSFLAVKADLGTETGPDLVVERCVDAFGGIDALINNAGIYEPCPFLDMTAETWDKTLHPNLRGPALTGARAAREMIAQGTGGRIVNIASLNATAAEPGFAHYGSSKAGLISLTQAMAVELAPYGIQTNGISPGWIATPMVLGALTDSMDMFRINPLGRLGEPDELAGLAVYLCTDAPAFITGHTITFDGGQSVMSPRGN